ncbi:trace amine-associated receptor 8b-like [Latimeria chalumnae]|uniref:trace amine-associated receptor 8b-like n=1 Tax=Latimeria chalumnae TaxID=7897 RepID=UPI0006D91FDA|nr:PREDICTED: trace amine-associated receptor 8b-like [Latimeria chalumnae]|eukprot:XP_014339357.1 PREDICTED: trace amine-associated receptor 8b-like [Latimeria chalumnae]
MNSTPSETVANLEFCFEHINGSCIKTTRPKEIKVILYIVLIFPTLVAVFGNAFVIISISHFKQLHSPNNMLIHSLATVDCLIGLCVMPFSIVRSIESCWYLGSFFCKLHTSLDLLLCTASFLHLGFIAIDRFYAVCDPFHYTTKITVRVALLFIFIGWIGPTLYTIGLICPGVNDAGLGELVASLSCVGGCFLYFNKVWVVVDAMVFFVPCFTMLCMYTRIFIVARRQAMLIKNMEGKFHSEEQDKTKAARNRENKATKTLAVLLGIFLFCWVSYYIIHIYDAYHNFTTSPIAYEAAIWLAYLNSTCNPLIYAFFYPWFRKALKLIVTGKIFSPASPTMQLYSE